MFNPFRKNAKPSEDLEPSAWQKFQFSLLMAWTFVKSKVGGALSWVADSWPGLLMISAVAGVVTLLAWTIITGNAEHKAAQHQLETAPCSEFASYTMQNVPIRCLPNYGGNK